MGLREEWIKTPENRKACLVLPLMHMYINILISLTDFSLKLFILLKEP